MSIYIDKFPNRQFAKCVCQGFAHCSMLNYHGPRIGVVLNTLLSADQLRFQAQLEQNMQRN